MGAVLVQQENGHRRASTPPPQREPAWPGECLESYLAGIARIPLLTPEEERPLARRAADGDQEARRQLVASNLRLVVKVAARYARYGLPLCDLIQEGNLGLIKAVERFDPDRRTRFSTYATYWIREAITRALTHGSRAMRISGHVFRRFHELSERFDALTATYMREPTLDELASAVESGVRKVSRILAAAAFSVSLDDPGAEDRRSAPLEEIPCDCSCDPAELTPDDPDPRQLRRAMETLLDSRERWIVVRSFGLDGQGPSKLKEMAEHFHVSPERVRQIRERALFKLRRYLVEATGGGGREQTSQAEGLLRQA